MAYDNPIPGFDTYNTINLRLWKAMPRREFDFVSFNSGDYHAAVNSRERAENISAVRSYVCMLVLLVLVSAPSYPHAHTHHSLSLTTTTLAEKMEHRFSTPATPHWVGRSSG